MIRNYEVDKEKVITAKTCHCCHHSDYSKVPYPLPNSPHIIWSQCNHCGDYTYIRKELVFETEDQLKEVMKSSDFIDYMDLPV